MSARLNEIQRLEVVAQRDAAIARTTQSLAHDVRKPFSMFKSIIQIVEGTKDLEQIREVLRLSLPEVNQAMASVEGMITDVMQIGAEPTLDREDAAPESLVEAALGELFRVYPDADVSLSYDFAHRHNVVVDSVRFSRVFANIFGNAVQAMREKGSLWIRTAEKDGFVTFALGNEGSFIPPESLPKLFEAFFTSGKKGGTGLGLAIANKIVEAHGGTIRCLSSMSEKYPQGQVEFHFTLPVASTPTLRRADALPRSSREIQAALAAVRIAATRPRTSEPDAREEELEAQVIARLDALPALDKEAGNHRASVLVLDDESVYRNGLLSLLERSKGLSSRLRMVCAKNDTEAFAAVATHAPALVIADVDLGPSSANGIEVVKILRAQGFVDHICVHSNRFLQENSKAAIEAGADSVLPKPLGRAHFLKLLLASLPDKSLDSALSREPRKLSVAIVDDSFTMRFSWKRELDAHTRFSSFAGTREFFAACDSDPMLLGTMDVLVSDYNFASGDPHDGGSFARVLRERGYQGLILRASGETELGEEIEALFDGDVGKLAPPWPEFQKAIAAARARRQKA